MARTTIVGHILLAENDGTKPQDIPDFWKYIRFDTCDILHISAWDVLPDHTFGSTGKTPENPLGDLQTRCEWVIKQARTQKHDIKIVFMQWYNDGASLDQLGNPMDQRVYTDSVRDLFQLYMNKTFYAPGWNSPLSMKIDGYDIDYEAAAVYSYVVPIIHQLRTKLDALSQSPKFTLSLSPSVTTYLDSPSLGQDLDYISMQNYSGGKVPDTFIGVVPNFPLSKLYFGMTPEITANNFEPVKTDGLKSVYSQVKGPYKVSINGQPTIGPLGGVMIWRLNSGTWVFENMAQAAIYNNYNPGTSIPGLEDLVQSGWLQSGGWPDPFKPFCQTDWQDRNEYKPPVLEKLNGKVEEKKC